MTAVIVLRVLFGQLRRRVQTGRTAAIAEFGLLSRHHGGRIQGPSHQTHPTIRIEGFKGLQLNPLNLLIVLWVLRIISIKPLTIQLLNNFKGFIEVSLFVWRGLRGGLN